MIMASKMRSCFIVFDVMMEPILVLWMHHWSPKAKEYTVGMVVVIVRVVS